MNHKTIICKIGGKILENPENIKSTISQLTHLYIKKAITRLILIPGGGSNANFVRFLHKKLLFSEDLAHWMAVGSMDCNGTELNKKFTNLTLLDDFTKLIKFEDGCFIFLPYKFLKENDELPHSWDVTSDSITLFIANKIGLDACFLIKDVDGIYDKSNKILKEISVNEDKEQIKGESLVESYLPSITLKTNSQPIDHYILHLIKLYKISCFIINGKANSRRILDFFDNSINEKQKIYSKIVSRN